MAQPGDIEAAAAGEAMRLVAAFVAWTDRTKVENGRAKNMIAVIHEMHLTERTANGTTSVTARAAITQPEAREVVPIIDERRPSKEVIEAARILRHLDQIDPRLAYVAVAWARRTPLATVARYLHCTRPAVYGHLKAAVAVAASCVTLRVFAESGDPLANVYYTK